MLAFEINVHAEVDKASDRPTESNSDCTSDQTHSASFGEEKAAHVSVARTNCLHDSDFAPKLEDGHHQCIHDADRSNGQGKAAEDREEPVEHGKKLAHAAGRIDNGKSAEAHFLDGIFNGRNLIRILYSHAE